MTFKLGRESYGLPVLGVREIIRLCPITPVPRMPDYIKGVINLRGKVIPILDLRAKFQLSSESYGEPGETERVGNAVQLRWSMETPVLETGPRGVYRTIQVHISSV